MKDLVARTRASSMSVNWKGKSLPCDSFSEQLQKTWTSVARFSEIYGSQSQSSTCIELEMHAGLLI